MGTHNVNPRNGAMVARLATGDAGSKPASSFYFFFAMRTISFIEERSGNMYFKINEFAMLTGISTRMIDYYTKEGLFNPVVPNPDNKYRYYTISDVEAAKLVFVIQAMGSTAKPFTRFVDALKNPEENAEIIDKLIIPSINSEFERASERRDKALKLIEELRKGEP